MSNILFSSRVLLYPTYFRKSTQSIIFTKSPQMLGHLMKRGWTNRVAITKHKCNKKKRRGMKYHTPSHTVYLIRIA